ncbi:hypothetical protein FRC01_002578 [Tulasnella sp. 417]|nr:hypothetical protein FRC01_002578 [Tulasnella sp. 417]
MSLLQQPMVKPPRHGWTNSLKEKARRRKTILDMREPGPSRTCPETSSSASTSGRDRLHQTASARSSGSSVYGSWTPNEAAEAHRLTAGFERLEMERQAKAQGIKLLDDLADELLDKMDIVTHEDD